MKPSLYEFGNYLKIAENQPVGLAAGNVKRQKIGMEKYRNHENKNYEGTMQTARYKQNRDSQKKLLEQRFSTCGSWPL